MIKTLLILILSISLLSASDLTDFWGLDFGVSKDSAVAFFQEKGCEIKYQEGPTVVFSGTYFAGTEASGFSTLFYKDKLCKVSVVYEIEPIAAILMEFWELKDMVTKKYGKSEDIAYFENPYEYGDGFEVQALRRGKAHFFSLWKLDNGSIGLRITKGEDIWIMLTYEYNPLMSLFSAEKKNKDLDDL